MRPTEFMAALRKGKLAAVYFLRGPDRFLHEECRSALAASVPAEARDWCLADIEFQPGHLAKELQGAHQMPMLGGHSFFLISDPEDFRHATDEDYEALQAYLERPSPFATLVFAAVEPDRRRRFIQLLEKKAMVVEMQPLARREAAAWLSRYVERAGVGIDAELAEEIAAKFESSGDAKQTPGTGVNLLWMRTEIDKLLTAKAEMKRLERDDLESIVAFREEHEIGKLLLAIAQRALGQALEHLHALLASKVAETLLLWCIADLIRQSLKSTSGPEGRRGGGTYRAAGRRLANPFSVWEIAPLAAGNYSLKELLQALRLVRRTDLGIKSSWKDSKILLEFLIWQIVVGKSPESSSPLGEELSEPSTEP